jgi:hypothetical protein
MMQGWFAEWLAWPVPMVFASLFAVYLATAALTTWLCFASPLRDWIQGFRGIVAPFFSATAVIFGLLIAFLANDIWDRNKQAERIVAIESETLIALYSLSTASGGDNQRLRAAIRAYVSAVVEDEWPRLMRQQRSPRADAAVNALLKEVAIPSSGKDPSVQRTMLDMVLKVHNAHEDRIALASDRTIATKWLAVLLLAFITQVSIAVVHLDKPRPQVAALFIFSVAAVLLLGLLAVHEAPFEPPVFIPPGPIAEVLQKVPK